jgi:hypothetical protein
MYQKTINIPPDRMLHLELPPTVPVGPADISIDFNGNAARKTYEVPFTVPNKAPEAKTSDKPSKQTSDNHEGTTKPKARLKIPSGISYTPLDEWIAELRAQYPESANKPTPLTDWLCSVFSNTNIGDITLEQIREDRLQKYV